MSLDQFQKVIDINLTGEFLTIRECGLQVLTAEFFPRNNADKIRCMDLAPGYVARPMGKNMDEKIISKIVEQVPIGRLIEPEEIGSIVAEFFRNEAMAGETVFAHGGLRLGSKG